MSVQCAVISGTVTKTNGNGFIIDSHEGWLNFSKFAKPQPAMPTVGERVLVSVKDNWVFGVDKDLIQPESAPAPIIEHKPGTAPNKEQQITRMACLNTSTAVLSSGGRAVTEEALLCLATRLEAWVMRDV